MSPYLTASELAELVGCKSNQKRTMQAWLETRRWRFELDKSGLPKVARAYHDRKMGINDDHQKQKFAEVPNLGAFA
ncbi:DUF4224 domain-containing protein [Undibacterium sp. MH2W]|uniref:DUF4224 domain-containing protein n=1 Tax=Undibacterium sp. MH2W TaxID=3413044 RepID=UPI003BF17347